MSAKRAERARRIIKLSYLEGAFYAAMVGCSETFALFYATKAGLSLSEIGLLSSFPILLGSIFQWITPRIKPTKYQHRRTLVFYGIQVVGLLLLCLAVLEPNNKFPLLLAALCLYWIGGMTSGPLWLGLMSHRVPNFAIASFLSMRNAFVSAVTLAFYLGSAFFLEFTSVDQKFLMVFAIGALARALALATQAKLGNIDVSWKEQPHEQKEQTHEKFRKCVMCVLVLTVVFKFAVALSSPFFTPFMIREKGFGVLDYVLLTSIPFLARFLFLKGLGRASINVRAFAGIQVSCLVIAIIPSLWATFQSYAAFLVFELIGGIFWAGFELSLILIIQRYSPRNPLNTQSAHMAAMNGAMLLGALVGGSLLDSGMSYESMFLLSSGCRSLIALGLLICLTRFAMTKFQFHDYRSYLATVMSLRPSMSAIGRLLAVPSRARVFRQKSD